MSHEQFSRDYAVESASNRRFGLIVGGIFALIGCIRAYLHGELGWLACAFVGLGVVLMGAALLAPEALTPVNRAWNKLGVLLHKVTNPVFLGLMYAFAIVPTGLAIRASTNGIGSSETASAPPPRRLHNHFESRVSCRFSGI